MRLRDSHFRFGLRLVIEGLRDAFPALRERGGRTPPKSEASKRGARGLTHAAGRRNPKRRR